MWQKADRSRTQVATAHFAARTEPGLHLARVPCEPFLDFTLKQAILSPTCPMRSMCSTLEAIILVSAALSINTATATATSICDNLTHENQHCFSPSPPPSPLYTPFTKTVSNTHSPDSASITPHHNNKHYNSAFRKFWQRFAPWSGFGRGAILKTVILCSG